MEEVYQAPQVAAGRGSETMLAPLEVQRMLALQALGWGSKRCPRRSNFDPPCRLNFDPGLVAGIA